MRKLVTASDGASPKYQAWYGVADQDLASADTGHGRANLSRSTPEHLDTEICARRNQDTFVSLLKNLTGADGKNQLGEDEARRRVEEYCRAPAAPLPVRFRRLAG